MAIDFPPGQVCEIIKACGEAGVQVFKFGSLYLRLGPIARKNATIPGPVYPMVRVPNHTQQNLEALEIDEQAVKEERLRMMMIENPMEYERQVMAGELDESREPELDE